MMKEGRQGWLHMTCICHVSAAPGSSLGEGPNREGCVVEVQRADEVVGLEKRRQKASTADRRMKCLLCGHY